MEIVVGGGGGGLIFIYSCSAQLISFGIDGEHDYMNISPPTDVQNGLDFHFKARIKRERKSSQVRSHQLLYR